MKTNYIFCFFILIVFLLHPFTSFSQPEGNKKFEIRYDSAWLNRIKSNLKLLIEQYPDSAALTLKEIEEKSRLAGLTQGLITAYLGFGNLAMHNNLHDSALQCYFKALSHIDTLKTPKYLSILYNNIGSIYLLMGDYNKAAVVYEKAIFYAQRYPTESLPIASIYNNYSLILSALGQYDAALEYLRNSIDYYRQNELYESLSGAYNNIGLIYTRSKQYQQSISAYDTAIQIARQHNLYHALYDPLANRGSSWLYLKEGKKALTDLLLAKQLADTQNIISSKKNMGLANLGSAYLLTGNYLLADQYLHLAFNKPNITAVEKMYILSQISELYEHRNQPTQALRFFKQFVALKDSIENQETKLQISLLESKFKTAEKDKEIVENKLLLSEKNKEITRKNIGLISIAIASFLIILWLIKQNQYRQKRLKDEKEMQRLKGLIEGGENERIRLAKDLHDGVNSRLASARMLLEHLSNQPHTFTSEIHLLKSTLSSTSEEVRQVAHNLLPEDLKIKGLQQAIIDYAQTLFSGVAITPDIQLYGNFDQLEMPLQLNIYRIIQELLHNIVKHAQAKHVTVILHQSNDDITLIIEDDGIGIAEDKSNTGIGIQNVKERVAVFNGNIKIDSSIGKSTHIEITFPV